MQEPVKIEWVTNMFKNVYQCLLLLLCGMCVLVVDRNIDHFQLIANNTNFHVAQVSNEKP